jgi:WD40 repeat protein/serine/threonine protein kinase/DNA-binding SARP family transcriptional activator
MTEILEITLLGTPLASIENKQVTGYVSSKAEALLYYLAASGQAHRREVLAGLLWSDSPETTSKRNLRDVLSNLRRLVGPYLQISRHMVNLNAESPIVVDSQIFSEKAAAARTTRKPPSQTTKSEVKFLVEALSLYRGEFLSGFYLSDAPLYEEWLLDERYRLQRELEEILELLVEIYAARGDYRSAISHAQRWLSLDPLRESAHQELMRLYAWDGDRAAALNQYQMCSEVLIKELGVEPAPETRSLHERILSGEPIREEFSIRGYELDECIGEGSFGAVYRARQLQTDRQVAIKVIRPQFANQVDFIRRFEKEAHLVARLEHPHIVPLYDFWREPNGAFLVMRWLRAGSLQASLKMGAWEIEPSIKLVSQITEALACAHSRGVVHRDIKPANILLDEEGNAYLSDFGIAKDIENLPGTPTPFGETSSPAYSSPEQLIGERVTPKTDIYSLGLVIYEMLTGEHPFSKLSNEEMRNKQLNESLPSLRESDLEIPPILDEVIQRATAKDPDKRYPDILSMGVDFGKMLAQVGLDKPVKGGLHLLEPENPYKGLQPFLEADAEDFFGREAFIEQLLARLAQPHIESVESKGDIVEITHARFLAVIGPSGSGKSSVVRAGLIPALNRGALSGSQDWFMVSMHPGEHPLEELENALMRIAAYPPKSLLEQILSDRRGLLRAIQHCLPDLDSRFLLCIDQFEETFSLVEDEDERDHFINSLYTAVTAPDSPLVLIITLRADFYDRPLHYPEFGDLVRMHQETIMPLSSEELSRAVSCPAEIVGVQFEPGLETQIVADVVNQPGALPLLQYAMTDLFEHRDGHQLTLEAYNAIGGVIGALGSRAEEIYAGLDVDAQKCTRQLFLHLVTLGEGVEDSRRRVNRSELESLSFEGMIVENTDELNSQKVMCDVIDLFGRYRLLTFDHDPLTRAPTVEIAHEALLREWSRLCSWLNSSREEIRIYLQLSAAALEWSSANRNPGFLLHGSRLDIFEDWWKITDLSLSPLEGDFLEASLEERRRKRGAEEARQKKEKALELRWRYILTTLAVVLAIAAAGALWLAATARQQANIATSRELAASALDNLLVDPERSILLSLQALTTTHTLEAENALHRSLQNSRVLRTLSGHQGPAYNVAFSPDGTRLATTGQDMTVRIWDLETGAEILTLEGHLDEVFGVDFSPDGTRLATTGYDGAVIIWDAESGKEVFRIPAHEGEGVVVYFSPDGTRLVTNGLYDGKIKIWDATTGEPILAFPAHQAPTWHVIFSPDGTRLATASMDGTAKLWNADSGELLLVLPGQGGVTRVGFSPDGSRLVTANENGTASVWETRSGDELFTIEGHKDLVIWSSFSPDGERLATASMDGIAKIWDASSGKHLLTLAGHTSVLFGIAFSPDGTQLATGSYDGTTRLWDLSPEKELFTIAEHTDYVYSVDFSPDGRHFASGSYDGTAIIWNLSEVFPMYTPAVDAAPVQQFILGEKGDRDRIRSVSYSPDGKRIVTTDAYGKATIWNAETGNEVLTLSGHAPGQTVETVWNGVTDAAFSPDGSLLATSSDDLTINIWDATTGEKLHTLLGHMPGPANVPPFEGVVAIAFNPEGTTLLSAGADGTARLWDVHNGDLILKIDAHPGSVVTDVDFSPDGNNFVTSGFDGTAIVWDVTSGESLKILSGHSGPVMSVAYSPDGQYIATGGDDGTARIWDAGTGGILLNLYGHTLGLLEVEFSPDGKYLATSSQDGTVRFYVLSLPDLIELAQSRLTRHLTEQECQQYLHEEKCPDS